jgi:hypothetical protein
LFLEGFLMTIGAGLLGQANLVIMGQEIVAPATVFICMLIEGLTTV